jgi:hypothetical protein
VSRSPDLSWQDVRRVSVPPVTRRGTWWQDVASQCSYSASSRPARGPEQLLRAPLFCSKARTVRRLASSEKESPRENEQLAWSLMQQFVDDHRRWRELATILGCRPGGGRARVLFRLQGGPMTLGNLARAEHFDAPFATVIVDKLEGSDLPHRTSTPQRVCQSPRPRCT